MILLTCEQCQTQYRLDPGALGKIGRDVRCTRCSHTWFCSVEQQERKPDVGFAEPEPQQAPIADDASFAQVMEAINATLQATEDGNTIPEAVRPFSGVAIAGAPALPPPPLSWQAEVRTAVLSFLLMVFISFAVVIPARGAVVSHWPAAALLFEKIGFAVPVTGDGLRLTDLRAEYRKDGGKYILDVSNNVTNIEAQSVKYPAFKIILQGRGDTLKEWRLEKEGQNWIAPGDTKPMKFSFPDVPPGGVAVMLTFTE